MKLVLRATSPTDRDKFIAQTRAEAAKLGLTVRVQGKDDCSVIVEADEETINALFEKAPN